MVYVCFFHGATEAVTYQMGELRSLTSREAWGLTNTQ